VHHVSKLTPCYTRHTLDSSDSDEPRSECNASSEETEIYELPPKDGSTQHGSEEPGVYLLVVMDLQVQAKLIIHQKLKVYQ
jgi:hypothetical protein